MKCKRLFSILWKSMIGLVIVGIVSYISALLYIHPFHVNTFRSIEIPFPIHRDGAAISTDFKVKDVGVYELDLRFHFSGPAFRDNANRDKIRPLIGDGPGIDGTYFDLGVPVTLEYRLTGIEKKTGKQIDRKRRLVAEGLVRVSEGGYREDAGGFFAREIGSIKLYPGTYHIFLKTIGNIPEFSDIPVFFHLFRDMTGTFDE